MFQVEGFAAKQGSHPSLTTTGVAVKDSLQGKRSGFNRLCTSSTYSPASVGSVVAGASGVISPAYPLELVAVERVYAAVDPDTVIAGVAPKAMSALVPMLAGSNVGAADSDTSFTMIKTEPPSPRAMRVSCARQDLVQGSSQRS